jgi:hypothetical protein
VAYIVEVKRKESVKVGERYAENQFSAYQNNRETFPIMEDRIFPVLRQEVETLDIQELVKLLNKIV